MAPVHISAELSRICRVSNHHCAVKQSCFCWPKSCSSVLQRGLEGASSRSSSSRTLVLTVRSRPMSRFGLLVTRYRALISVTITVANYEVAFVKNRSVENGILENPDADYRDAAIGEFRCKLAKIREKGSPR